VDSQIGGRTT